MTDGEYCPRCGNTLGDGMGEMYEDLLLNVYRTEFRCLRCDFVGEVIRHSVSEGGDE